MPIGHAVHTGGVLLVNKNWPAGHDTGAVVDAQPCAQVNVAPVVSQTCGWSDLLANSTVVTLPLVVGVAMYVAVVVVVAEVVEVNEARQPGVNCINMAGQVWHTV